MLVSGGGIASGSGSCCMKNLLLPCRNCTLTVFSCNRRLPTFSAGD